MNEGGNQQRLFRPNLLRMLIRHRLVDQPGQFADRQFALQPLRILLVAAFTTGPMPFRAHLRVTLLAILLCRDNRSAQQRKKRKRAHDKIKQRRRHRNYWGGTAASQRLTSANVKAARSSDAPDTPSV